MLLRVFISSCLLLFSGSIVKADNVVITGGSVTLVRNPLGTFNFQFSGADFMVQGVGSANISNFAQACYFGCTSSGNFNSIFSTGDILGTGVYQGSPFLLTGNPDQPGEAGASFALSSPDFVFPPELLDSNALRVTAPFAFSQPLSVVAVFGFDHLTVSGDGTVTALLLRQSFNGFFSAYFLQEINYNVGPVPSGVTIAPVPEPATLTLFVLSLPLLLRRVLRR